MSAIPKGIVRLPQVEQLLQEPVFAPYIRQLSRPLVTDTIRDVLAAIRRSEAFLTSHSASEEQIDDLHHSIYHDIEKRCQSLIRQRHHKVINATGTVVHTNLGRSPIDPAIWEAVSDVNTGQCNLEIKLTNGKRGQRKGLVDRLMSRLVGAEDAMVVNNNASSIYLMLNELAKGKEVIVSRGEQIQIGGGFRIPDILALSGASLVEVGTTNITTADDYLKAVTDNTAMVLMVHCSNFAIRGFTESPDIRDVAKKLPEHVVLAVDQGSGLTTETFAAEETPAAAYLKAGADIVCFSGDKILGGPQAGIVCGKAELVHKLEKNPLMRAFRPSRIVYSLLEELLVRKLNKDPEGKGIAEQRAMNPEVIKAQAEQLANSLGEYVRLVEAEMVVGGGTLPDEFFPSWALEIISKKSAEKVLADLRNLPLPVIGVIRNNAVQLNMAAILPHDLQRLEWQLKGLFHGGEYLMNSSENENKMRAVIGTAGHVDHGKTALIKALTGITTARAHEQACGMTLDLGFAHFDDDNGHTVGVIDVPGHERFIRNMVAGVWSLDLVLLVVAADEGWMPMSTDHLKVAHAMGIRNVILCINKSDAVDADTLALVEEETRWKSAWILPVTFLNLFVYLH